MALAKQFKIPRPTVTIILIEKEAILKAIGKGGSAKRARMKSGMSSNMEEALVLWIKQERRQNISVSENALEIAALLNMDKFEASESWLTNFKQRHGILFKEMQGEAGAINVESLQKLQRQVLRAELVKFKTDDIFNVDETCLFWQFLQNENRRLKNSTAEEYRGIEFFRDYTRAVGDYWHTYDIFFADPIEHEERLQIFAANLKLIKKLNNKTGQAAHFHVSKFTAMTQQEFKDKMLSSPSAQMSKQFFTNSTTPLLATTLDSFDWRDKNAVTSVKDQGTNCGSCYAFSAIAVVESQIAISGGGLQDVSEQDIVSCDPKSDHCKGGYVSHALEYVQSHGYWDETAYPYTATDSECSEPTQGHHDSHIESLDYYDGGKDENGLKGFLAEKGPFAFFMNMPIETQFYESGIMDATECSTKGHALAAVAYGENENGLFWLAKIVGAVIMVSMDSSDFVETRAFVGSQKKLLWCQL